MRNWTYSIGCVRGLDTRALEEEADRIERLALAVAVCVHQLFQLRVALDLEKHFVIVVGDFDVKVL